MSTPADDARTAILEQCPGRDAQRRYRVTEIDPLTMSSYMLRLVSALRVDSLDDTYAQLQEIMTAPDAASDTSVNALFKLLGGCDPAALHALITDLLKYVEVARDPRHPTAWMPIDVKQDMREMSTLGKVLGALVSLNFRS
jgi:hypothetical protein